MHFLYFYNLVLFALFPFFRNTLVYVIAVTFPLFLLYLPDTNFDFSHYENTYYSVYFDIGAPLFFRSATTFTAEPGWFTYTGIISLFIEDFRHFLVFNFLVCLFIIKRALKIMGVQSDLSNLMIALMVPIQFVTIMFWSPRSSLPLALCFYSFALLHKNKLLGPLLLLFIAAMIHSQYIVIIVSVLSYYLLKDYVFPNCSKKLSIIISFGIIFGFFISIQSVVGYLSFLPSAEIISSKIGYLDDIHTSAFRVTGLLSIVVFPAFMYLSRRYNPKLEKYRDLLILFTVFSFLVNVAFFDNVHVAGRLSRATDYFLFPFVLAFTMLSIHRVLGAFFLIPVFLIFPFMYPALYKYKEIMGYFFG